MQAEEQQEATHDDVQEDELTAHDEDIISELKRQMWIRSQKLEMKAITKDSQQAIQPRTDKTYAQGLLDHRKVST